MYENNFPIQELEFQKLTALQALRIPDPPRSLFLQGSNKAIQLLDMLPNRGLSIIGSRTPQYLSRNRTRTWIQALNETQLIIVSGFARGIDTIAHEAALEAGLPTIAILGAGIDVNYPSQNSILRRRILESDGLLISEFPQKRKPYPSQFLHRNRLIAFFSNALLVVEASNRSGTLNTARWALESQSSLFAVPCFPGDPIREGNQKLIDHSHALPFWGPHNLGSVWLELSSLEPTSKERPMHSRDRKTLEKWIKEIETRHGMMTLELLQRKAEMENWENRRLLSTLKEIMI